jgi:hypothetical protein
MPNVLEDLEILEVSLVDNPSNASVDPVTGKKVARARIAFWKRDSHTAEVRKDKKMKFTDILKSATTREQIVAAVEGRAAKIAKRDNVSVQAAIVKAWSLPGVYDHYESLPKADGNVAKAGNQRMVRTTAAEAELDKRARKRMAKTGVSFPKATSEVLNEDPGLYDRYQAEVAAGEQYDVPDTAYLDILAMPTGNVDRMLNKQDDGEDDDDEDCPECEEKMAKSANFCPSCGIARKKTNKKQTPARGNPVLRHGV